MFPSTSLLQKLLAPGLLTIVDGFMVIVNVWTIPEHPIPLAWGVMVMVPVIGLAPKLIGSKEILPVPLAGSPIAVLLFVQLYPGAVPVKDTVSKASVLQNVFDPGLLTIVDGFTVTVNV